MDEDKNVNQDTTPEGDQDSNLENGSEELQKANELAENYKIRAEKAEKALKANKTEKKTPKNTEESDKPDVNARLDELTLRSEGVTNSDDVDFVKAEAAKAGKTIDEILKFDYVKETLKKSKAQRTAEDGMPDGSGKKGGGAKSSVDYWVDKVDKNGAYENPPNDPELTIKVINARMEKERRKLEFPD